MNNPQLIIIAAYLVLLLGLGLFSSRLFRGTSKDYMLASHSIGPLLLLLSLFGTTMTAFALVGSTGKAWRVGVGVYGMMASSSGIVHSLCFFLIGLRVWKLGRRHGYITQVQFLQDRLESPRIGLLLFPILVALIVPYLLIGVKGAGAVVSSVTADTTLPVPGWLASLVICLVVLVYVFAGGMRGTAWANAFQTTVFIALGVVTFLVITKNLGGQGSFLKNLQAATAEVVQNHPDKLTRGHVGKLHFLSFMLIPLSAGTFPHLFQHWLTAKSANSFKLPVIVHPLLIMVVWAPCVLIGVWATSATVDGSLIVPADLGSDARVLPMMVNALSGSVLAGLLSAGILAAIMSSLDSQFLCLGTMFTEDIMLRGGNSKALTERQTVLYARVFIVVVVAATYLLSLVSPASIFDMAIWCFSGFTSLIPLVFAALYWKRLTAAGACASTLVALVAWWYMFYDADFGGNPRYLVFGMLPVATMFGCSTVALVVVSLVTRPPTDKTLNKFFSP